MNTEQILSLRVIDLRQELERLGLSTTGRKQTLQDRLLEHFGLQVELDTEVENQNSEEFHDSVNMNVQRVFTLNDIRESLDYFDGTRPQIEQWVANFEENAQAVNWDDLQKFLYAKQLIKGAAKIFLRGQSNVNCWNKLKKILLDEFGTKFSAIDVHKTLQNRRKRNSESYLEYLYSLIEIGAAINIDEQSIVEYFIDGLPDSRANKSVLYDAENIVQLKLKIKNYEKMKTRDTKNYAQRTNHQLLLQCSNCPHLSNHKTEECKKLNNLCFKCGKKGHKAHECRSAERSGQSHRNQNDNTNRNLYDNNRYTQNDNRNQQSNNRYQQNNSTNNNNHNRQNANNQHFEVKLGKSVSHLYVNITMNGHTFKALFDTGSDISMIGYSLFKILNVKTLSTRKVTIYGVGQGQLESLGYIVEPIIIDGQKFNWRFHVVNDDDLNLPALLGSDVLEIVNVYINECGPRFKLKEEPEPYETVLFRELLGQSDRCDPGFEAGLEFRALCLDRSIDAENNLDLSHIENNLKQELLIQIDNYKINKTKSPNVKMRIVVTDNIPVFHRPRRLSIDDQKVVEAQIQQWLKEGIIRPSQSEYAAPIVLAKKKDGSKRLCCDFRKLNQKIVRDNFPMVLIDDVLVKLQNAKIFTTLDLKNGFFHVPIEDESIKYTSFVSHLGQFEYLMSPFGLTNSPAVFCRYLTAIFNDLILDGTIIIYMDDIVIPSQNELENLKKLTKVLKTASEYGLEINWKKCQFIKKEINFLGYIIKDSSIQPSKEKTKAVSNFPQPTDIKSLQKFLGLTSYFRRFIKDYSTIAKPLTDLLSKNTPFEFDSEQNIAFTQLKISLTECPILQIYNPLAETEVHCDASMYGLGAALMQKSSEDGSWHPVEYMSKKNNSYERKYHSYDLEVLAIVTALKKWRPYLLGIHFKIITDCIAFTQTLKKSEVPARITRWVIFLEDFDYEIEHRKGNKLNHVDALSRMYCLMMSRSLKHRIIQAQNEDVWTKNLKELVTKDKHPEFFVKNEILFQNYELELLVVPRAMEQEIIETAHKQGHFSTKKTIDILKQNFYIQNINEKTAQIVRNCVHCIVAEAKKGKKEGLLNPIEKSSQPLETFHIDHVGPLENTHKQYNHILTIVDGFSKFTWLYPTKSTGTNEVINILEKNASIFGHPSRIVTDRGTAFTSNAFKEYCEENNITHVLITTGVPRANGQVERIHKTVIALLTKLCLENKQNWYKHLNNVQQTINNTPPRSTKISPFKIMTGIDMKITGLSELSKMIEEEMGKELQDERENLRNIAKENIIKIQNENRQNFNKNRKIGEDYQVGDVVAIKRTQFGSGLKIKPKFLGPYKVTKKKRNGRYEVEKLDEVEGPIKTTTIAENMKLWKTAFGSNTASGRPNVGNDS